MDSLAALPSCRASARRDGVIRPVQSHAAFFEVVGNVLALVHSGGYSILNTRAAPLVRKVYAHQGRVFYCPRGAVVHGALAASVGIIATTMKWSER